MRFWSPLLICIPAAVFACSQSSTPSGSSDDSTGDSTDNATEAKPPAAPAPVPPPQADPPPVPAPVPPPPDDAGAADVDAASAAVNAFTDAPPFMAKSGPPTDDYDHWFADGTQNPAGQACLDCHDGHSRGVTPFVLGGTVYLDDARTIPAASVEVRVRDVNGQGVSAYTDNFGNFFIRRNDAPDLAPPWRVGVRDILRVQTSANLINSGNCASCHRDGGQPGIILR